MKDVRSAARGRQVSVQRLAQAKKQGLRIPTLEEAMERMKVHTENEKAARSEAHSGQVGQQKTAKERRLEAGKKTKEEVKAESKVKDARKQTI